MSVVISGLPVYLLNSSSLVVLDYSPPKPQNDDCLGESIFYYYFKPHSFILFTPVAVVAVAVAASILVPMLQ